MPRIASPGEPTPAGMVRLSWGDYVEEAGEAARVATLAMAAAGTPATAAARPLVPSQTPQLKTAQQADLDAPLRPSDPYHVRPGYRGGGRT
jgi:hypothetical protein